MKRGYRIEDSASAVVSGSREASMSVLEYAEEEGFALSVHYCSAGFKDGVQLRNRLLRRAETIARPMDVVTPDGTILKGVVECGDLPLEDVERTVVERMRCDPSLVAVDPEKGRVEVAPWILEKGYRKIPFPAYLVEEYPTFDRLEVERTPLTTGKRRRFGFGRR